jgi:hypothetical protein
MRYFNDSEFERRGVDWAMFLSEELRVKIDLLRMNTCRIDISPNEDAVGRELPDNDDSKHNINYWESVLALDIFPRYDLDGDPLIPFIDDFIDIAKMVGFTGIGVYTDVLYKGKPHIMFHVDVRPTKVIGHPATWGRVNQKYVSIDAAIEHIIINRFRY